MDGKKADKIKQDMIRNPKKYLQPKVVKDKLTGEEKIDDEFFSAYGNVLNESMGGDKNDQKMHKSTDQLVEENSKTTVKSDKEIRNIMRDHYLDEKYTRDFVSQDSRGRKCKRCSAMNGPRGVLCWYCSQVLYNV